MTGMTFEAFQASRRWSSDLWRDAPDYAEVPDHGPDPAKRGKGWVYHGGLVIERVQPWWPAKAQDEGSWYLRLCNLEWISDDLEELENRLWVYACDEGIAGLEWPTVDCPKCGRGNAALDEIPTGEPAHYSCAGCGCHY